MGEFSFKITKTPKEKIIIPVCPLMLITYNFVCQTAQRVKVSKNVLFLNLYTNCHDHTGLV